MLRTSSAVTYRLEELRYRMPQTGSVTDLKVKLTRNKINSGLTLKRLLEVACHKFYLVNFNCITFSRRMRNLEGSMSQLLDSREKKIKTLETTLKELKRENLQMQQEVEVLKLKVRIMVHKIQ